MKYLYEEHKIYVLDENNKEIVRGTFPFIKENVVNVDHTFVDPSLRGQGIASILMTKIVEYAESKGYKMTATCPYAVNWFQRHKEYNYILDVEEQEKLAPECLI